MTLTGNEPAAAYVDARASDIKAKIAALGSYVADLACYWQGSAQQAFETLMADYHIYASMLDNAMADIANGLRDDTAEPGPRQPENVCLRLRAQARDIAADLHHLAVYLNDVEGVCQQGLLHEWNIAVAGLFGRDGVIAEIAREMNAG